MADSLESVDLYEGIGAAAHHDHPKLQTHGDGESDTFVLTPELTEQVKYELVDSIIGVVLCWRLF